MERRLARQTLLLVDADPRSARVLEVSLRNAGYSVAVATCGAEALAMVDVASPDLVITDTHLPDAPDGASMDGFALCRAIQGRDGVDKAGIIFLTSSTELEDKIRGLELGVEDYLTRPIYVREVVTRIQLVLARKRRDGMVNTSGRASFSGSLADMGLVDLLTTLDIGRKTGVLEITSPQGRGTVSFLEGQPVEAKCGSIEGEFAVFKMLAWNAGLFEVRMGPVARPAGGGINLHSQALLMEGMRRVDEWQHLVEQLPPLDAVYQVDAAVLAQRLGELPDEVDALLKCFDGVHTLLDVVEESRQDDLTALGLLSKLYFEGLIHPRDRTTVPPDAALLRLDPHPNLMAEARASDANALTLEARAHDASGTAGASLGGNTGIVSASAFVEGLTESPAQTRVETPPGPRDGLGDGEDEGDMAKHKGKRAKTKRDSLSPSGAASAAAVAAIEAPEPAQSGTAVSQVAPRMEAISAPPDKTVRVEGNVIQFPKSASADLNDGLLRPNRTTVPAGSASTVEVREAPAQSGADAAQDDGDDAHSDERPAVAASAAEKKRDLPPGADKTASFGTLVDAAAKRQEPEAARAESKPVVDEAKPAAKTEAKPTSKPAVSERPKKDNVIDVVVDRKDNSRRERKESLSTHLSDEARAFFSDEAYKEAYKQQHDTFEDLAPAQEDHAHEVARSKRWMTITGALLCGVIGVLVAFSLYSRMGVPETAINTERLHVTPVLAAPTPPPTPAPAPEVSPPAPVEPTPTPPTAVANTGTENPPEAPVVAPTVTPTPAPEVAVAPTPAPAVQPAPAPTVAPPAAAGPSTPAQLLAAARSFHGPLAGKIAAYDAYFTAAPTDDATMGTLAFSLAEGHPVEAEAVAARAVAANPSNGRAWFVLAYARRQNHNAAGATEARTHCIGLGGTWASECRAM